PEGDTAFNIAAYSLREENRLISDQVNASNSVQVGKTKSTGIELEYKAAIGRQFNVVANYNYINLDDQLEGIPAHQASVWGKYKFAIGQTNGFSVGAGVRWLGSFRDGTAPETPDVTL